METIDRSLVQAAEEVDNCIQWINSIGLKTRNSRLEKYSKQINEMAANFEAEGNTFVSYQKGSELLYDIEPFCRVFEAFRDSQGEELDYVKGKLYKGLKGHESIVQESDSKSLGRNFMFELLCNARVKSKSANSKLLLDYKGDGSFEFHKLKFNFEAKRLRSLKESPSRVKKALDQLEKNARDYTDRRIVALDLSSILNPNYALLKLETDNLEEELHKRMVLTGRMVEQQAKSLFARRFRDWHGIMFYLFCCTINEEKQIVSCSRWHLEGNPAYKSTGVTLSHYSKSMNQSPRYG